MQISWILAAALALTPQKPAPTAGVKLVSVGEISKIDKVKRSFELRTRRDANDRVDLLSDDVFGDIRIGVTLGGTPNADPGRPAPNDPRTFPAGSPPVGSDDSNSKPLPSVIVTKIFLTDTTACKEGGKVILCEDLKATDSVRVTGDERREARGAGIYATEVVRNR